MRILYVCTHNRCRSILSEAITNQRAIGELEAVSAGSEPAGEVHPLTLKYLVEAGYSIDGLRSQSWNDFEAWFPDVVITVCDKAAGEVCPLYLGTAIKIHWSLLDPSALSDDVESQGRAFRAVIEQIEHRVDELREIARQPREYWPQALKTLVA